MQNFTGVIIEESLEDKSVLDKVKIVSTKVEQVIERHRTPWVKQWTLHTVEVPAEKARELAEEISQALESEHPWYADYKTNTEHYIIFRNKVFLIDRTKKGAYKPATEYGVSIGIPDYQVDFDDPNQIIGELDKET